MFKQVFVQDFGNSVVFLMTWKSSLTDLRKYILSLSLQDYRDDEWNKHIILKKYQLFQKCLARHNKLTYNSHSHFLSVNDLYRITGNNWNLPIMHALNVCVCMSEIISTIHVYSRKSDTSRVHSQWRLGKLSTPAQMHSRRNNRVCGR